MSMFLFDETPIFANPTLAKAIGLNEALVLQQLNYWIEVNRKTGKNFHEGRYWTYNSIRAWKEDNFDYLSLDTVKRTFARLVKSGYLLTGNFNKDPRDKTKWYTINEEKLEELYFKIREEKLDNSRIKSEIYQGNPLPNALVQNAPMDQGKTHQCNDANESNALGQIHPTQWGSLPQALPNNTSDNTTENKTDTSSSIYPSEERWKKMEENNYENRLKEQVGFYFLSKAGNFHAEEQWEEIIRILADVFYQREGYISINQIRLPIEHVQERYLQLNMHHMEYIVECLSKVEGTIHNIRAYILTTAYNAPSTIDAYYTNQIQTLNGGI